MTDPVSEAVPPRRVPLRGQVLDLAAEDSAHAGGPTRIEIIQALPDISMRYGGDWIWVEAWQLDGCQRIRQGVALVRCAAIPDDTQPGGSADG